MYVKIYFESLTPIKLYGWHIIFLLLVYLSMDFSGRGRIYAYLICAIVMFCLKMRHKVAQR